MSENPNVKPWKLALGGSLLLLGLGVYAVAPTRAALLAPRSPALGVGRLIVGNIRDAMPSGPWVRLRGACVGGRRGILPHMRTQKERLLREFDFRRAVRARTHSQTPREAATPLETNKAKDAESSSGARLDSASGLP